MYKAFFKRALDIIFSFLLLILLSPILLLFIILLSISNKGTPFFIQNRPGLHEQAFNIIKFKTMNDDRDENGNLLPDKYRLTKVGSIVRKLSIDELPQFINVLKGDMSFIGPRPLLMKYLPYYNDYERKRHNSRPGITGLAQVNGRNVILWEDRIKLDVEYTENLTFSQDVSIVFQTIKNIISKKDIAVIPSEMGRVTLDVRRDPKNAGLYDENGFLIKKD